MKGSLFKQQNYRAKVYLFKLIKENQVLSKDFYFITNIGI